MAMNELSRALFRPQRIALVGASGDATKNTARPQRFLRKHGFTGTILPINPGRPEILGEPAFASLEAAAASLGGAPIDHVFIMTPAASVLELVRECVRLKVPVATLYSDGFAERGEEGRALQEEIVSIARAGGLRLLGPNALGVIDTHANSPITCNATFEGDLLLRGNLAIISQSGSMMGSLMSRAQARGFGFSRLVSVGNECDIGVGELVDLMVDDPNTDAILLFLETLRDAPALATAARRAFAAGKPVIAYKLGRSEIGRELAASHTGAMTGADDTADAFFRAHGIVRVGTLESLLETAQLLGRFPPSKQPRTGRRRVGVVTTTGGGAATVVDQLGLYGIDIAPPTEDVIRQLAEKKIHVGQSPMIDLTLAGTKKEIYSAVLDALLASDDCDAVLAVVGSSAQFHPQLAVEPIVGAKPGKPLLVFIAPAADTSLDLLRAGGVPAFRTPESCADAIRCYFDWQPPVARVEAAPAGLDAVAGLVAAAGGAPLNERDAAAVFSALGIPAAPSEVLAAADQGSSIPFPVVAKVLSRDVLHKTDAGGVVLGIVDAAALRAACGRILDNVRARHPEARIDGVLVQKMERGLAEVILGYRNDPQVGPVVIVGAGGTLAEIYKDYAIRSAPVDLPEAHRMISEVKALALVRGYRGLPAGDVDALAEAVVAFSMLALLPGATVAEAEINPLLVKPAGDGVVAVDGLLVTR
ncbi:MAG: acetate--CoA ligase family protein [bacterium]